MCTLGVIAALTTESRTVLAQTKAGVVLDQTGLPLPGATIRLVDGGTIIATVTTHEDGSFEIDQALPGATIAVSLDGFETSRVDRAAGARIVLSLARAIETTTVVAPTVAPSAPTTNALGSTLAAATVARLPSSRLKARESLPLLPSVVRGPDGLMRLGGARAYETPLLLDGFNVTDPATGTSSLNLPFEAVRGVDVLRDPMAVTYGRLLGGLVQMESRQGGDRLAIGVQGVVPRPRFTNPGVGRIEGIFPRAHVGGATASGRVRYLVAAEYDFERIPVPEVTFGPGPDVVEQSSIVFSRVDVQLSVRNGLTLEGLAFPSRTESQGLGPRREEAATADVSALDVFGGLTDRFVVNANNVVMVQVGLFRRNASLVPVGTGPSRLTPFGWSGNWFATIERRASRYSAVTTWEHIAVIGKSLHDITVSGSLVARQLVGSVREDPVVVLDAAGRLVRAVEFEPQATIAAHDWPRSVAVRDVWQPGGRLQIDAGARFDQGASHGGGSPSGRIGARVTLDSRGLTVVKAGYGSFVGNLPLGVEAFADYPARIDRSFDPETGAPLSEVRLRPAVEPLRLPRAVAAIVSVERQLRPGLDAQLSVTDRRSTGLATLRVPFESGLLAVGSTGVSTYRELQLTVRRVWDRGQQLFASYVRSSARGELNDFNALVQGFDVPLLQPGGQARLMADAPNRLIAWGTFNLPRQVVLSPVIEWRSGFPYSALNEQYRYAEPANGRSFPPFLAADLVLYKTFTVRKRSADLGIQLFNATNHRNPRDVYPVVGAPRSGEFANVVGPILRGYMLVKW
jgi:hypothetical protein